MPEENEKVYTMSDLMTIIDDTVREYKELEREQYRCRMYGRAIRDSKKEEGYERV